MTTIHKLYCHECRQVFESLLVILPKHELQIWQEEHETAIAFCNGSNTIAELEIAPCPHDGIHAEGKGKDCPYCNGMIRRPIRYQLQSTDIADPANWMDQSQEEVIRYAMPNKPQADINEFLAALCGGEEIKIEWRIYRGRLLLPNER